MTDDKDKSEIVEQLEAQAVAMDAGLEELGIVKKSEYEATQKRNEELQAENEALEEDMESLQEEVSLVKEAYADELSEVRGFGSETLQEKFTLEELREEFEDEFDSVESLAGNPNPKGGDTDEQEELAQENQEEIEALEEKIATYEDMGWESNAEAAREELAELRGEA